MLSNAMTISFPRCSLILMSSLFDTSMDCACSQELMEPCFEHVLLLHLQSVYEGDEICAYGRVIEQMNQGCIGCTFFTFILLSGHYSVINNIKI